MTEAEVLKIIMIMEGAARKDLNEKSNNVYKLMLADLPYKETQKAVLQLIATGNFMPSIAEIRRTVIELTHEIPSVEEAWIEVREAGRSFSPYTNHTFQWSHPLVKKAAEVLGGVEAIGYSDNIDYLATQFFRVYERLRESEMIRLQTSGVALPAPNSSIRALKGAAL